MEWLGSFFGIAFLVLIIWLAFQGSRKPIKKREVFIAVVGVLLVSSAPIAYSAGFMGLILWGVIAALVVIADKEIQKNSKLKDELNKNSKN